MAKAFLLDPAVVTDRLRAIYRNRRQQWLAGEGDWPLKISLGPPTERQALEYMAQVRRWQDEWYRWKGPGQVEWMERRWRQAGTQRIPTTLEFTAPEALADCIGTGEIWRQVVDRFREVLHHWPMLSDIPARDFDILSEWPEPTFRQFIDLLCWLQAHAGSGLYPRQVPVAGIDSKWLGTHQAVVERWLRAILGGDNSSDLYELAGLRRPPVRLRLRLLDPDLRRRMNGLGDVTAPVTEIAGLELPVKVAFIVENLQTGLAFEDLPGGVVFMQQGYAVDQFAGIPWFEHIPCYYWGDLDTHGFAILDRLRKYLPHACSLLMDEVTLLHYQSLCVEEPQPCMDVLTRLNSEEGSVYKHLQEHTWGIRIRLEQERIPWDYAWEKIRTAGHTLV